MQILEGNTHTRRPTAADISSTSMLSSTMCSKLCSTKKPLQEINFLMHASRAHKIFFQSRNTDISSNERAHNYPRLCPRRATNISTTHAMPHTTHVHTNTNTHSHAQQKLHATCNERTTRKIINMDQMQHMPAVGRQSFACLRTCGQSGFSAYVYCIIYEELCTTMASRTCWGMHTQPKHRTPPWRCRMFRACSSCTHWHT